MRVVASQSSGLSSKVGYTATIWNTKKNPIFFMLEFGGREAHGKNSGKAQAQSQ
jgi:hypothetical protein